MCTFEGDTAAACAKLLCTWQAASAVRCVEGCATEVRPRLRPHCRCPLHRCHAWQTFSAVEDMGAEDLRVSLKSLRSVGGAAHLEKRMEKLAEAVVKMPFFAILSWTRSHCGSITHEW